MAVVLSSVYHRLKGGPGAAPFAAKFVGDTKLQTVNMLETRAAPQRDWGRLEKRAYRNHVRSNSSRYKVLPQDKQGPGERIGWGPALQNRPWGSNSSHQFGAKAGPLLPCSAAGATTRAMGDNKLWYLVLLLQP